MSGPAIRNPTPSWLRRENASVLDSPLEQLARMLASIIGADDPSGQAMGIAAPVDVPGGATSPIAQALSAVGKKLKGITAYHGSPHDFDKFSLDKIGTGEGAQAYGHGLYFAEAEDVAKSYRDDLTQRPISVNAAKPLSKEQQHILSYFQQRNIPIDDDAVLSVGDAMTSAPFNIGPRNQKTWDKWKSAWEDMRPRLQQTENPGRMYEVNIAADPEDFLDWDAPLSQQSEKVRASLANAPQPKPSLLNQDLTEIHGREVYQGIGKRLWWDKRAPLAEKHSGASEALKQAGIPGIKYLDGASRSAGQGSRNYVVFDDQLISIVKKYGIAGAVGAGLINQAQAEQLKEQGY